MSTTKVKITDFEFVPGDSITLQGAATYEEQTDIFAQLPSDIRSFVIEDVKTILHIDDEHPLIPKLKEAPIRLDSVDWVYVNLDVPLPYHKVAFSATIELSF